MIDISKITRYTYDCFENFEERKDGDWINYFDVKELIDAAQKEDNVLRNALEEAVDIIHDLEKDSQCNYGGEVFMDDVIRFRNILSASTAIPLEVATDKKS